MKIYVAVMTLFLVIDYTYSRLCIMDIASVAENKVEIYNLLLSETTDRTIKLFGKMVYVSILPIFTNIIGFIFGRNN